MHPINVSRGWVKLDEQYALVLTSEPLPRENLSTFEDWSTVLVKTQIVNCRKVGKRGFRVWRILGWEVVVYNVDMFEGCHTCAPGTMVG